MRFSDRDVVVRAGKNYRPLLIWDLEPTKRILGYQPQDNAGEKWTPRADRKGLV